MIVKILQLSQSSFKPDDLKFKGHKNALLLTHDTDATNLYDPKEILFNMVKGLYR